MNQNPGKQTNAASKISTIAGMQCRLVATTLVTRVIDDGRNLDALSDRNHGLPAFLALESRDQALARAIAITCMRHRNKIDAILKRLMKRPPPKNARFLNHSLHLAAAQILFMEVPDSAAVNIAVSAIGADKRTKRFKDLANAVLRRMTREKLTLLEQVTDVSPLPGWLAKMLRSNHGKENLEKISAAISQEAMLDISTKSDAEAWAEKLGGTVLPTGSIRLGTNQAVVELEGYDAGEWWVQDAAAAIPAKLIQAPAGSKILELCAAPGGKTAQLVNSGFDVTAIDISKLRLDRLRNNLDRLNLKATTIQADILEWEPDQLYDAVLLDAPCSSTGTVRRHPDVLWSKKPEDISELAAVQFELVKKAITFLKPGGQLVFSNCSMLKEEGENLLAKVLKTDLGVSLSKIETDEIGAISPMVNGQGALRSQVFHLPNAENPQLGGLDGFFACRLVKQ